MLPVKHGSPTVADAGYQVDVVDEAARPLPAGTMGSIVIKLPMPPGCLPTLWEQDERCREAYFNEFSRLLQDLRRRLQGRGRLCLRDGPHRRHSSTSPATASTGGMEEILASHPDVAECAVLGIKDPIKGEVPAASGAEGRRCQKHAEIEKGPWRWCATSSARRGVQSRSRWPAAEDTLWKNPGAHHQEIADGDSGQAATIEDPSARRNRRCAERKGVTAMPSLRANGRRKAPPDERLREQSISPSKERMVASSRALLAMTEEGLYSASDHQRLFSMDCRVSPIKRVQAPGNDRPAQSTGF